MPSDGIARRGLLPSADFAGVGGRMRGSLASAHVIFRDGQALHVYAIDLIVMPWRKALANTPSLPGRNILDRWSVTSARARNLLEAEILTSDAKLQLPDDA
jgi:hypothetical protein